MNEKELIQAVKNGKISLQRCFDEMIAQEIIVLSGEKYKRTYGSWEYTTHKVEERYSNLPYYEEKQKISGYDYITGYVYNGFLSRVYKADGDFFSTLSNGQYEYYGMLEDIILCSNI